MANIVIEFEDYPNPQAIGVHVNFDLKANPPLYYILQNIMGVESVDLDIEGKFQNKYSFTAYKGRVFDADQIKSEIKEKIQGYFNKD